MKRAVVLIVTVSILLSGCMSTSSQERQEIVLEKETPIRVSGVKPTTEPDKIVSLNQLVKVEKKELITGVSIKHTEYNSLWDIQEYGFSDEPFHPEQLIAWFEFEVEGETYSCRKDYEPPKFRGLIDVFCKPETAEGEGYKISLSYEEVGCEHFTVNFITSKNGTIVWEPGDTLMQRDRNPIEGWAIDYTLRADVKLFAYLLDEEPVCDDSLGVFYNECNRCFSRPEEYTRFSSFYFYVVNKENNVWIQERERIDLNVSYRWIDHKSGEALECRDTTADLWEVPDSGMLGLQIERETDVWETVQIAKIRFGDVVAVSIEVIPFLVVDEYITTLKVGAYDFMDFNPYYIAIKTLMWTEDEILGNLPNIDLDSFFIPDKQCDEGA